MTERPDPRGHMVWIVWARLAGMETGAQPPHAMPENGWVAPVATFTQEDAWEFARGAVQQQRGTWEFTVRHVTEGPPDY